MRSFDEETLQNDLQALGAKGVVAFALACAERMFPNYQAFQAQEDWGNSHSLRVALDMAWHWLRSGTEPHNLAQAFVEVEEATPDTEDFAVDLVSPALDAAVATAAVLELIVGAGLEKAVEIASLARDTVDMFVQEAESMDSSDPRLEERILAHDLMQAELASQHRDIIELSVPEFDLDAFESSHRFLTESNIGIAVARAG